MMNDVLRLAMIDQAKLIKEGEISPAELLVESIQQIEKVNPKINAVVLPMFDLAREAVSGLSGKEVISGCILYTSPSQRDGIISRMPYSA